MCFYYETHIKLTFKILSQNEYFQIDEDAEKRSFTFKQNKNYPNTNIKGK